MNVRCVAARRDRTIGRCTSHRPRSIVRTVESQLPAAEAPVVSPELTVDQLARLGAYGTPDVVDVGEAAFAAGDPTYDLVVIENGVIEVVRPATANAPPSSPRTISTAPGRHSADRRFRSRQMCPQCSPCAASARGGRARIPRWDAA
jgi:hypothetical protein